MEEKKQVKKMVVTQLQTHVGVQSRAGNKGTVSNGINKALHKVDMEMVPAGVLITHPDDKGVARIIPWTNIQYFDVEL